MQYIPNILFLIALVLGVGFFAKNLKKLARNIKLGRDVDRSDNKPLRWRNMAKIALGQYKMVKRPVSGILHVIVYVGFVIINIEVLEIIIDGLFGTHRILGFMGGFYNFLIGSFEILAFLVFVAVVIFWIRRNVIRIKRFLSPEMKGWPKMDGNVILYFELVLMTLFLVLNAADFQLQTMGAAHYASMDGIVGSFPVSQYIAHFLEGMSETSLIVLERSAWWLHIIGILIFLNYLYYSKHLHILLAFPNTYYANLKPQGELTNVESVTKEVMLMMDPDADPYAVPEETEGESEKFGASDVMDLNWVQLMNAYSCTECGRCTSECPANQTGKKLSPRKIMMDTRDRLETVGKNIDANDGIFVPDGVQLLDGHITKEELWACTTCNACVEACPIGIDPLSIIVEMRRYMVMEESSAPADLNNAMTNIENNGAPWPFNQMDRANWIDE